MAEITIKIQDEFIKMGKALVADEALRNRFDVDPVGTMKDFGIKLPEDLTNEKLKKYGVLSLLECKGSEFKGPEVIAEVEVIVDAAMTPATIPIAAVVVGVVVAVKPND